MNILGNWTSINSQNDFIEFLFIEKYFIRITKYIPQNNFTFLSGKFNITKNKFFVFYNTKGSFFSCDLNFNNGILQMFSPNCSIFYQKNKWEEIPEEIINKLPKIYKSLEDRFE
jgi:hypothetical protein